VIRRNEIALAVRFMSAIATASGELPVAKSTFVPNEPSPFPSSTETVLGRKSATQVGLPVPVQVPIATEYGLLPVP